MPAAQRSLVGHPGAILFWAELTARLFFNFVTSSRPRNLGNVPTSELATIRSESVKGRVGRFATVDEG
jgi:hypothetical protein